MRADAAQTALNARHESCQYHYNLILRFVAPQGDFECCPVSLLASVPSCCWFPPHSARSRPTRRPPSGSRSTGASRARRRRSWSRSTRATSRPRASTSPSTPRNGSLEPINRVASGTYDMGFGDINSLIRFRDANPGIADQGRVHGLQQAAVLDRRPQEPRHHASRRTSKARSSARRPPDGAYAQWPIFVQANEHRRLQGEDRERRLPGARADAGRAARSTPSPASRSPPTST